MPEPDVMLMSAAFRAELMAWQATELRRLWMLRLRELAALLADPGERR